MSKAIMFIDNYFQLGNVVCSRERKKAAAENAISAADNDVDDALSILFGRCVGFLFFSTINSYMKKKKSFYICIIIIVIPTAEFDFIQTGLKPQYANNNKFLLRHS